MATLNSKVVVTVAGTLAGDIDAGSKTAVTDLAKRITYTSGTGADQADRIFQDTRQLAASGTENLDLAGVLTDAFGATMTFARIKAVIIVAATGNTNNVQVTRPAANGVPLFMAASDGISLAPGDVFAWASRTAAGIAVTAGTGDLLTITNSAGSTTVDYDVVIIGASA